MATEKWLIDAKVLYETALGEYHRGNMDDESLNDITNLIDDAIMKLPYQVFNPSDQCVMHAPENCRYPRRIELDMLEAGYTIKLNGRKITKTELRKDTNKNGRN